MIRVAAVVVTHNRLALLKQCVDALSVQTHPPECVIVVDNASDDGTREWLDARKGVEPVHQGNLGGAGGFWRGIKEAMKSGTDWVWIMDDDTIPAPDCLERLVAAAGRAPENTGLLCSKVLWSDGSLHRMNCPRLRPDYWEMMKVREKNLLPVSECSFVSAMFPVRAVRAVGLPLKEMFVWSDDVEYTRRVTAEFPGYQVMDSVAEHRTKTNYSFDLSNLKDLSPVYLKYGLRNQVFLAGCLPGSPAWRKLLRRAGKALSMSRRILRQLGWKQGWPHVRNAVSGVWFNPRIDFNH